MKPGPESRAQWVDSRSGRPAAFELVVAASDNDVIGRGNALPWRLPADLRRFKQLTWGLPVLMGRRTHESIGRPLPGRTNLVMSRTVGWAAPGCSVVGSVEDACRRIDGESVVMVIGGADVYRQCLPLATRIHLTRVHTRVADGDAFFAGWRGPEWCVVQDEPHAADEQNAVDYSFVTLLRRDAAARTAILSGPAEQPPP